MEAVIKASKKHNFSAGPAILPNSVIQQAAEAVTNFNGSGLSILEISHRSKPFVEVMDESFRLVKELLDLDDSWAVMWLTGGASSQFFMTAMNLLNQDQTACYVDTGTWSSKAIKEAKLFGNIEVLASSKDKNYSYIPKNYTVRNDAAFLHLTSNNTIFGTEYHWWPETDVPIVCDMSSDIFSRPIDIKKFGLIYAGAQKNLGPAGTTLVIVRKELLGKVKRQIPTMLNYQTHIDSDSSFNTPPVYPIYVCTLTLRWLKEQGGLAAMADHNSRKAKLIYDAIDSNPCYLGVAEKEDRSLMNATFILNNDSLDDNFQAACKEAGCIGMKGHRSAGGFRASIYNALPLESAQVLVDVMNDFGQKHG